MPRLIHPIVVHFSITLIIVSVILFLTSAVFHRKPFAATMLQVARWQLWTGSALLLASIGTGFVDYLSNQCDQAAMDALVEHRRAAQRAFYLSLAVSIAVFVTRKRAPGPLLLVALVLLGAATFDAARLGGQLTYTHGVGVTKVWLNGGEPCVLTQRKFREWVEKKVGDPEQE